MVEALEHPRELLRRNTDLVSETMNRGAVGMESSVFRSTFKVTPKTSVNLIALPSRFCSTCRNRVSVDRIDEPATGKRPDFAFKKSAGDLKQTQQTRPRKQLICKKQLAQWIVTGWPSGI